MQLTTLISALPVLASLCSAIPHSKRAVQDNISLYAYGTNVSGLSLVYGNTDGLVYIASTPTSNYSYLTMDISNSGTVAWNGTIDNTTSIGSFFIVNDGSTFSQAGFLSSNTTSTVTNASTIGFSMFGGQVVFIADGTYLSQFWAQTTDVAGIWSLLWNSDGSSQTNSVPVTIKTIAISTSD